MTENENIIIIDNIPYQYENNFLTKIDKNLDDLEKEITFNCNNINNINNIEKNNIDNLNKFYKDLNDFDIIQHNKNIFIFVS